MRLTADSSRGIRALVILLMLILLMVGSGGPATAQGPLPERRPTERATGGSTNPLPWIGAIMAAAGAGFTLGRMGRRPSSPAPLPMPPPTPTPPDPDRDRLVATLVDVADQSPSEATRVLIAQQLATVGVTPIHPGPGDRFDPEHHRGVHARPTADPALANTIAAVERPGWSDRGRVLRPPDVEVHVDEAAP